MTDERQWKRMMFKGLKVWLHVDENERPVISNRKVLIKYQLNQDHEYWVPEGAVKALDPTALKGSEKRSARGAKPGRSRQGGKKRPKSGQAEAVDEHAIVVYTDGASSGNPGPAGIGVILRYGAREKEISEYIGVTTNNVAELTAIKRGLEAIRTVEIPVRLFTDSQYCYGLLALGWEAKRNETLVASTRKLLDRLRDVRILKVAGHSGVPANERADELARAAIARAG